MTANVQSKQKEKVPTQQGTTRAISSFIDPSLSWKDLPFFKSITNMPIILKGIQTGEDAVRAYETGMDGLVVSNHGGRQLDFARSVPTSTNLQSSWMEAFVVVPTSSKHWPWVRKRWALGDQRWSEWPPTEPRVWKRWCKFSR